HLLDFARFSKRLAVSFTIEAPRRLSWRTCVTDYQNGAHIRAWETWDLSPQATRQLRRGDQDGDAAACRFEKFPSDRVHVGVWRKASFHRDVCNALRGYSVSTHCRGPGAVGPSDESGIGPKQHPSIARRTRIACGFFSRPSCTALSTFSCSQLER